MVLSYFDQAFLESPRVLKFLLDTNIISEPMKHEPNKGVINRWLWIVFFACTSAAVWHELWYGVKLLNSVRLKEESFKVLAFG